MKLTEKKKKIIDLFHPDCEDLVFSEVGYYPLDAISVSQLTNRDIRATRRSLEALVRDGLLVREKSEGYYEVSTGRTMHRPGVAYDIPAEKRIGRKPKEAFDAERKIAGEQALQKLSALMRS